MNISQKILLQRKKKGISQEDLANALNVSRQAVSKWESSQSVPDMDKIVALSSYFNITTDYLLKDEIETIDGADNYSSKNVDMQMLNKELSEKVYKANGVPLYLGLALTNISAYIHLFIMSIILYIAAPLVFNAEIPENPSMYFISLAIFIAVSLSIASIIGLAVKDQAKTSMFSIIVFLPSIMLSGIMFPMELLPKAFETIGKLFPATWGYKLMTENVFKFESLLPLLLIFVLATVMCSILLRRIDK